MMEYTDWNTKVDCWKIRKYHDNLELIEAIDAPARKVLFTSTGRSYGAKAGEVYYNSSNLYVLWYVAGKVDRDTAIKQLTDAIFENVSDRINSLEKEVDKQYGYLKQLKKFSSCVDSE